jgi:hypothetical protein
MISGLAMKLALPVLWFTMPRGSEVSLYVALGIALLLGISDMAWGIGAGRLLFVSVVPPEKKTEYMALHYAWMGVIGGVSQLLGGRILDLTAGLSGEVAGVALDPYTPLFALGLALPLPSLLLLMGMRADNIFGVGQFAGMFFRGNPFLAMGALVRYYMAKEERDVVEITERMGLAKSPLAVDELLETLKDPRFNVRFEAIVAIARMPADPRLTQALVDVLNGTELALKVVAAWALGRIGDPAALGPLRQSLDSPWRSIRAYSARALGALRDRTVAPTLLARLETEEDKGLQMAYASALGNLRAEEAVPRLLALLRTTENAGARMELALSVARILGDEQNFIRLLRDARADLGTAAAQAIGEFRRLLRPWIRRQKQVEAVEKRLAKCGDLLARADMDQGLTLLSEALVDLPKGMFTPNAALILAECAERLQEPGETPIEYVVLALHVMEVGLKG